MFVTTDETIDQARERRRAARRRELLSLCEQEARIKQRVTEIVREADDEGDWSAAGCSSSAQWLAQVCSSDFRSAARITSTSTALRSLPALDRALSTGVLSLDQVATAAQFDSRYRREARAHRSGKAAQRHCARRAHDRSAGGE
jgi:hypothetical protein